MNWFFKVILILFSITFLLIFTNCEREKGPVVPKNVIPQIDSLMAMPSKVLINSAVKLRCYANDSDKDRLIITWFSKRGQFPHGNSGTDVVWVSPSKPGVDTIFVEVSDGESKTKKSIIIIVGTLPTVPDPLIPSNELIEVPLSTELLWMGNNSHSYDLQISNSEYFDELYVNKKNIQNNSHKIAGLNLNSIYYWRVRGENRFGKSNWSKVFVFKTATLPEKPILQLPADGTQDNDPILRLTWNKIRNASHYSLQIAQDNKFQELLYDEHNFGGQTFHLAGLENFASYYWRVKAFNQYGSSEWSDIFSFSIIGKVPNRTKLIEPADFSRNILVDTKFAWEKINFASEYTLQISTDSMFSNIIINRAGLKSNSEMIEGLHNFTNYYWRVKSYNKYGYSEWSDLNKFITVLAKPFISLPSADGGETSTSPNLYWKPVTGADSYNIQVSSDSNFSDIVYNRTGITDTIHQVSKLNNFKNYYWRIAAVNDEGVSDWSNKWSFKSTGYFYKGLPYGLQSIYNPVYVILNGGFDMIQVGNKRDIKNFPYKSAWKNIWKNFTDPFTPIKNYGWENFIKDQVFPFSFNKKNGQFWPNYTLHLIGGGMEYAALREWYEYHEYPYPQWFAALTTMSYHLLNEVVENGPHVGDDVDPIADFYLFDIGGIILFTNESVKRFFSEDLNLADWSQQPSFSLRNGELHNNGQFFSVRWKFPFSDALHAFYYFGTNGVGGLSYKYKDGSAVSFGVGLAASDLITLDEKTNKKTLGLVGNFGVFYDKNNSLLASLAVTIKTDYMVNVNIYPGLIKLGDISPGIWGAYSQDGNVILGVTATWFPVGLAYSKK